MPAWKVPPEKIPLRGHVDGGTGTVPHASGVGRYVSVAANNISTTVLQSLKKSVLGRYSLFLLFSEIFKWTGVHNCRPQSRLALLEKLAS